ncbi:flavoprotein family protein [Firmicutes bacterium CAG:170]|nr:flavoprotein family protein [Firmicutes bacterium CAG:170]
MPETELTALLSERCARFPKLAAEELLTGLLQSRLGKTLVRRAGLDAEKPLEAGAGGGRRGGGVPAAERLAVGRLVKCCAVEAVGVLGMDSAQVTAGGIRTAQFRADTLESRVAPGIFACGEVLDIDGDCGGYNLQWAWSSGTVAGRLGKTGEETL